MAKGSSAGLAVVGLGVAALLFFGMSGTAKAQPAKPIPKPQPPAPSPKPQPAPAPAPSPVSPAAPVAPGGGGPTISDVAQAGQQALASGSGCHLMDAVSGGSRELTVDERMSLQSLPGYREDGVPFPYQDPSGQTYYYIVTCGGSPSASNPVVQGINQATS